MFNQMSELEKAQWWYNNLYDCLQETWHEFWLAQEDENIEDMRHLQEKADVLERQLEKALIELEKAK